MEMKILDHAKERMRKYDVNEDIVKETVENPDNEVKGYGGKLIAQKKLNNYVLRVVYEKQKDIKVVITVYKARRERYEI